MARVVGGGSLIIRLGPGLTGFCPGREMPQVAYVGDACEVRVVSVDRTQKGTPIQLSGDVEKGPCVRLAAPRPTAALPEVLAGRTDLAALVDRAAAELLAALAPLEQAVSLRDLDAAAEAIRAPRARFPIREGRTCPFASRVGLLRGLHDRPAVADAQAARRYWPASPHLPPAPPRAVRATAQAGGGVLTWKASSAPPSGVTYRVRRGDSIVADGLDGFEFTDTNAPAGTMLEYAVAAVASGKETPAPGCPWFCRVRCRIWPSPQATARSP